MVFEICSTIKYVMAASHASSATSENQNFKKVETIPSNKELLEMFQIYTMHGANFSSLVLTYLRRGETSPAFNVKI